MRNQNGTFKKGYRPSPDTEFKPGQHWRNPKPYWNEEWLRREYIDNGRSASEIAAQFGCRDNNILYFLDKFNIPRRTISEVRAIKYWEVSGPDNPMYGRTGAASSNWRGGITPERQLLYSSREWATAVYQVWERDAGSCQRCSNTNEDSGAKRSFHIHHIVPFKNKETRCALSNLMLLCHACHGWVHSKKNTERLYINE